MLPLLSSSNGIYTPIKTKRHTTSFSFSIYDISFMLDITHLTQYSMRNGGYGNYLKEGTWMEQSTRTRMELELRRLQLHQQESAAKSVPYISFILTHVALVLFLVASFFVDRLVNNPAINLEVKIIISVLGVLFLVAEWTYAIRTSLRWKKNITIFYELQREQQQAEEQERQHQQQAILMTEQVRNRALQHDLQRVRQRRDAPSSSDPTLRTPSSMRTPRPQPPSAPYR